MTLKVRASRVIRKRIAKRKGPRSASRIHLDKDGLSIEGERFPFFIGESVEIDHFGDQNALVTVGIFTDRVTTSGALPRNATLTQRFN